MRSIIQKIWECLKRIADFFGIKLDPLRIARVIAKIIHRKKRIWVFGSWFGEKYSDNSRYFYEYIIQKHPEIYPVWITKTQRVKVYLDRRGDHCFMRDSLLSYLALAVCEAVFYTMSVNADLSNRKWLFHSLQVQLWHGMPIKMIGVDAKKPQETLEANAKHYKDDLVIATSPLTQATLMRAFVHSEAIVKVTGLPRNDIFSSDESKKQKFKNILGIEAAKKVVVYLPTFRDSDMFVGRKATDVIRQIQSEEKLKELLRKYNTILLIKPHYHVENSVSSHFYIQDDFIKVITIPEDYDIPDLLEIANVLITDYSSCFIDYLLLDRPIIFYQYDIEKYQQQERGFYYRLEEISVGPRIFNFEHFVSTLEKTLQGQDDFCDRRKKIRELFHSYLDKNACLRVFRAVSDKLEGRKISHEEM